MGLSQKQHNPHYNYLLYVYFQKIMQNKSLTELAEGQDYFT